ncbi:Chromatin remodeling [Thalictrum thalictroides]|uniref:Chromatin remodeling n=1 Tax=Thalictrum thalictroides TaxID=46969 RepID=A0A7J6X4I0_THATH|nr:Chromatin remodeling [Thalictrum thalictroides]
MREKNSGQVKMIDRNWATKRKRKRLPCGPDQCNGKESKAVPVESPRNPLAKRRLNNDSSLSQSSRKKKGHDGYYYECVVCDVGGNLLCCESCPRTYHLQCLNPPLKRTPPGKWHCPTCCEQNGSSRSMKNAESTSRTRTRIIVKNSKYETKSSDSSKAPEIIQSCIPQKNRSSCGEKSTSSLKVRFVHKKPDSSQADESCGMKWSIASPEESVKGTPPSVNIEVEDKPNVASVDTSGNKNSSGPIKEFHSSGETSVIQSNDGPSASKPDIPCNNDFSEEKFKSPLVCATKKSKKRKHKKGKEVSKKRPRSDKSKSALKTAGKLNSPSLGNSKPILKSNFVDHRVSISLSKEDLREKSSGIQQKDKRCSEESPDSSNKSDEIGVPLDDVRTCEQNALVEVQQVDRILGCRAQSIETKPSHNPMVCSITPKDADAMNNSSRVSGDSPSILLQESSKNLLDDNSPGNKDAEVEDAKISQIAEDRNDSGKGIENNAKADKLHVYRRSVAKKCIQGEGKVSTGTYSQGQGPLTVNTAVPDESTESISDLHKVTEKSLPVEDNEVEHVTPGDCTAPGTSETSVPCVCSTKDVDSDMRLNNNTETKGEAILEDLVPLNIDPTHFEYLVKWMGQSHIHNSWVSEVQLKVLAKRKLENYKAKYGTAILNICHEEWSQPQRVIALRASKDGNTEAFVKWSGLPYDDCTWERLNEPAIEKSSHLVDEFRQFEQQTLENDAYKAGPMKSKIDSQPSEILPLTQQPKELKGGLLFQHQLEALNWLRKCWHKSRNVILADEMGLGKTVSACAFLSSLYFEFKATLPCLVLVPLSTMPNWLSEFALWAPNLNVVEYHGCARARSMIRQYEWHARYPDCLNKRTEAYKFNVLLTTYEMVLADSSHLRGVPWEVLIVDEGHRLKNSGSKLFSLLNSFSFQHRILLTGTPLQNNIGEMYNLLNFLQPASFPSLSSFEEKFNDLTTTEKVEELKKLVAPHMLRRLKKDVMQNIPPKTERMVPVELSSIQAEYYRAMLTKNYQILRNIGKGVPQQSMLNIVMQLRKVCNHPYLIQGTEPDSGSVEFLHEMRIKASAKLTLLHSMLKLLYKEGHRVLIFSQMTKLLDILEDYLNVEYGPKTFERVDGSVSVAERQAAIARFNHDKSRFVFLLSTRSCGLGINLATADTVIIYDSDFNPHADIQAMNRAHRIGQSNRLLVYRLVVRASVEERILQLARKKLMLDQLFVNKSESQKEVEDILRWGTEELFNEPATVATKDKPENSPSKDEASADTESKQRRRVGGLGDVYQDKCTDGNTKILWDDSAVLKLLDRSILQSGPSEGADGDLDNDMLGSVKSLEWNEEPVEEPVTNDSPPVAEDVDAQIFEKKEADAPSGNEENEWDRLLRMRWEKYQSEEEAALGRGKRLRKAVSYSEAFAPHPSEALNEHGGNEEETPEREYTPAGKILKAKFAKLRARQKERLAQRNLVRVSEPTEELPPSTTKEGEIEPPGVVSEQASQVDNRKAICPVDTPEYKSTSRLKHNKKHNLGTHLDLSIRPSCPSSSGNLLANLSHSLSYAHPANNLLPVLGLCAPNANQLDSANRKKHESENSAGPNTSQSRKGKRIPDFPFRLDPGAGTSGDMDPKVHESGRDASNLLDTPSECPPNRFQSSILDSIFSFSSYPLTNTQGRSHNPFESSGSVLPAFHDRITQANLTFDETQRSKISHPANDVPKSYTDLFPNLSLGTKAETTVQDIPTRPFLPDFRLSAQDMPNFDRRAREVPPMLGLGLMHGTNSSLPENHKKVLDNIMMRTGSSFKKRSKVVAWSEDELDSLWIGVRRHGKGNWDVMLRDPKLKFSKYRTSEDLSTRWEDELVRIIGEAGRNAPTSAKSTSFSGISDGMMARALRGSKLSGFGGDYFSSPKSQSHLTDMRLGYGNPTSCLPPVDPSDHFNSRNDRYAPFPSWKPDEFQSHFRGDFSAGPSNRGVSSSNLHLEQSYLLNSLPSLGSMGMHHPNSYDLKQMEGERGANKYAKLPAYLDRSLSYMHDSSNMIQSSDAMSSRLFSGPNKQLYFGQPSVKDHPNPSDSAVNKLPHWLREAVSVPAGRPEPDLPPTVSAIAHSVRLLYGEEKPTIPPFTVPAPLPSQPKDPRRKLKKKGKLHRLRRGLADIATTSKDVDKSPLGDTVASGSISLESPVPSSVTMPVEPQLPSSTIRLAEFPGNETNNNLPCPNLNPTHVNHCEKPGMEMSPPEVLKLVASCVSPEPHVSSVPGMVSPSCVGSKLDIIEPSKEGDENESMELKNVSEEHKVGESSQVVDLGSQIPKKTSMQTESGDSSKTHSDPGKDNKPEVDDISSEETVSDDNKSEQEQL